MTPRWLSSLYIFLVGLIAWIWVCAFTEPFTWWKLPTASTLFIIWVGIHMYLAFPKE